MNSFRVDRTDQVRIEKKPSRFTQKPTVSVKSQENRPFFEKIVGIIRGSLKMKNNDFDFFLQKVFMKSSFFSLIR